MWGIFFIGLHVDDPSIIQVIQNEKVVGIHMNELERTHKEEGVIYWSILKFHPQNLLESDWKENMIS
jgi:hypothetical protein